MSLTTAEQIRQRPQSPEVLIENTIVIKFKELWGKGVDTVILQKGRKYERNWHYQNPNDGELFYPIKFSSNISRDDVKEIFSKREYGYTLVDIDGDRLSVSWKKRSLEITSSSHTPQKEEESQSSPPQQPKEENVHTCSPSDIFKFTSYLEFRQFDLFKLELCPTHHGELLNTLLKKAIETLHFYQINFLVDLGAKFDVQEFSDVRENILVNLTSFKLFKQCNAFYDAIVSNRHIRKIIIDYAKSDCRNGDHVNLQRWLNNVSFTRSEILSLLSDIDTKNLEPKCMELLIKHIR